MQLARTTLGAGVSLMADANGGFVTSAQALPYAQMLVAQDFVWFEEPCVWTNYTCLQQLHNMGLPIRWAVGEQEYRCVTSTCKLARWTH